MFKDILDRVYQCQLPGVSGSAKAILAYLAKYANAEGKNIYPGVETISYHTGFSPATVKRGLSTCIKAGVLIEDGKQGRMDRYALDLEKLGVLPLDLAKIKQGKRPAPPTETPAPAPAFIPGSGNVRRRKTDELAPPVVYPPAPPGPQGDLEHQIAKLQKMIEAKEARIARGGSMAPLLRGLVEEHRRDLSALLDQKNAREHVEHLVPTE